MSGMARGRQVTANSAVEYAAKVQRNAEKAVQRAGFGGWVCGSGPLTVECMARIAAVLQENPGDWFPPEFGVSAQGARVPSATPDASPCREAGQGFRRAVLGLRALSPQTR